MDWISLLALAVALAMDAFAVSLAAGAILCPVTFRHCFRLSFHFGLFQGIMPIIGWLAGMSVHQFISAWDHWVAFGLLCFLGLRMIREAIREDREDNQTTDPSRGIPALIIGLVACLFSIIGVLLGNRIGSSWGGKVEVIGGLVLIGIGLKILFEGLFAGSV